MEAKIKNSLNIIDDIKFDVWFDAETGCGSITLYCHSISSTVLELITRVVDLVAITCIASETYRVTFLTK